MSNPSKSYQGRKGTAGSAAKAFRPGSEMDVAAKASQEVRFSRPSRFRYPISLESFNALKEGAPRRKARIRPMARTLMDQAPFASAPVAPAVASKASIGQGFASIPATGWIPYDCAIAVGKNHAMCAVNSSVAVFNRTGVQAFQTTLTAWFQNVLPASATVFDPRLTYDAAADRYILVAAANNNDNQQSWFLISVSQSGDPTGGWWSYALDATVDGSTATNNWADYPTLGQDANAIYVTGNMFQWNDGPFQYAKLRILPKQPLYSGGTPTFTDFVGMTNADGSLVFTMQPANVLDPGANIQLINTIYPTTDNPLSSQLTLWTVANALTNPTLQSNSLACNPYGIPPHADQKGSGTPLDTGDVRVMNAVVRNGFLWASFVTQHNWEGDATNVAAVFWVQIDANQAPTQQGIFGASGMHYFYPGIQPVDGGGCLLVFSRSSPNDFASLCAAGRQKPDPVGTLGPSTVIQAGQNNYAGLDGSGRNRWGDYSAVSPDANNAGSGWMYGGYVSGSNQWSTWVSSGQP